MSGNQNRLGDKWVLIVRAKVQKLHWEKQIYWNRFQASLILTHKSVSAITALQALSEHGGLRHNCFFPSNTCAGYGQRFSEHICLCFPGHWAVPCQCDHTQGCDMKLTLLEPMVDLISLYVGWCSFLGKWWLVPKAIMMGNPWRKLSIPWAHVPFALKFMFACVQETGDTTCWSH